MSFIKNIWAFRRTFIKLYGVDPEVIMSDQMPLHRNESSEQRTLIFKGASQSTSVKENRSLSRERITVMTSAAPNKTASSPNLEFVFKGVSKREKLNVPNNVSVQKDPKGTYRLKHVLKFIEKVPAQPCSLSPGKRKIFILNEYSAHLHPQVKEALKKKGYFLVILLGSITGDLQVNDTDVYHPLKSSSREKESLLMIEKLQENPDKIPSPNRDEIMQMLKSSWSDTIAKIDIHSALKRNGLTIELDGSEENLVSSKLKTLTWDEMKDFCTQLLNSPHPATIKKFEKEMIPPEGVKGKLNGVVDGIPPDKGYEILGVEPTNDEWDSGESGNESEDETNDTDQ